jgi:hypothetical protein
MQPVSPQALPLAGAGRVYNAIGLRQGKKVEVIPKNFFCFAFKKNPWELPKRDLIMPEIPK